MVQQKYSVLDYNKSIYLETNTFPFFVSNLNGMDVSIPSAQNA
jgi:hypothetical protein